MKQPVEKYKQKPSTIEVGKKIRKINKVKKVLTMQMMQATQQAMKMREALAQLDKGVAEMLKGLPKTPTIELDNQEGEAE